MKGLPHGFKPPSNFKGGRTARQKPGVMNGTEERRARELDAMLGRGEITGYWFQPFRYRIADDNAWYTCDFMVAGLDGLITMEEIKGHWEAAALIRIKVAASTYPFVFVALSRQTKANGGGWDRRVFKGWSDDALPPSPAAPVARTLL